MPDGEMPQDMSAGAMILPDSDADLEAELIEEFDRAQMLPPRNHGAFFFMSAMAASFLGAAALAHHFSMPSNASAKYPTHAATGSVIGLSDGDNFPGFPGMMNELHGDVRAAETFQNTASSKVDALMSKAKTALANLPTAPPSGSSVPAAMPQPQPGYGGSSASPDDALQGLAPRENTNDNNPCGDDEEFFESLCYRKCSILTNGVKPVRCASHICEPLNSNGQHKCSLDQSAVAAILNSPSILPCHGYDVAGSAEGQKRCPHPPGVCLKDEELYLGTCIKKCSILTNGAFPHRKAFATCCKSTSIIKCLFPGNSKTSHDFAAGGGSGDSDPQTPSTAHAPMQDLTR